MKRYSVTFDVGTPDEQTIVARDRSEALTYVSGYCAEKILLLEKRQISSFPAPVVGLIDD